MKIVGKIVNRLSDEENRTKMKKKKQKQKTEQHATICQMREFKMTHSIDRQQPDDNYYIRSMPLSVHRDFASLLNVSFISLSLSLPLPLSLYLFLQSLVHSYQDSHCEWRRSQRQTNVKKTMKKKKKKRVSFIFPAKKTSCDFSVLFFFRFFLRIIFKLKHQKRRDRIRSERIISICFSFLCVFFFFSFFAISVRSFYA